MSKLYREAQQKRFSIQNQKKTMSLVLTKQ